MAVLGSARTSTGENRMTTRAADAKRNEIKRNEIQEGPLMTTTTTTAVMMPAGAGVRAGDSGGCCKRAGCGRPLPPGERGRSRQFCSDECRIRHFNAMRGQAAVPPPPPADGSQASLGKQRARKEGAVLGALVPRTVFQLSGMSGSVESSIPWPLESSPTM